MRRCVFFAVSVLSLGLMACEDGPNQTYSPATGTLFNNGGTLGVTDDASAALDATYAAQSKQEICSGGQLQEEWAKMVQADIAPTRFFAGLDLAGGDQFPGLTLNQAENGPLPLPETTSQPSYITNGPDKLCQATTIGAGGDGSDCGSGSSLVVYWGNNQEVQLEYCIATQKALLLTLSPGYTGHMKWQYAPPNADGTKGALYNYDMQIGQQVIKTLADGSGPIIKYQIRWAGLSADADTIADIDELYNGIVSTFAPDIYTPPAAGTNCSTNGTCLINPTGNQDGTGRTVVGFRPASTYFETYNPTLPQPSGSTVGGLYTFNVKLAPYSVSNSYISLTKCPYTDPVSHVTLPCPYDQTLTTGTLWGGTTAIKDTSADALSLSANNGPVSYVFGLGDKTNAGANCLLRLGDTYGDLVNNCIQVYSAPATDTTALAKVLGNLSHDDQNFSFSVVGINQNYRPAEIGIGGSRQFDIIHDGEVPTATATADDFQSDVRTYGPIMNDKYPVVSTAVDPTTMKASNAVTWHSDYHGSGAVWKEYQRLVEQQLNADSHTEFGTPLFAAGDKNDPTGTGLHDASCYMTAAQTDPNAFTPGAGCTGFEGFITVGPSDGPNDAFNSPAGFADSYGGNVGAVAGAAGFKPGGPYGVWCNDPLGEYEFCGINGDLAGTYNDLLDGSLSRVIEFMGHGDINKVPLEGRDLRFYFKQFSIAMAKYLQSGESLKRGTHVGCVQDGSTTGSFSACGTPEPIVSANIDATSIDSDYYIFDSFGGGASRSEYIYLANADANNAPLDFELKFLLVGSNWQATNFYKKLDREEQGFFDSLALDETQPSWGYLRKNGAIVTTDSGFPVPNGNVFISNIAGSPALAGVYSDASDANGNPVPIPSSITNYVNICDPSLTTDHVDAYFCATHLADNATDMNGNPINPTTYNGCSPGAPADYAADPTGNTILKRDNGKPLLDGYCGIWNPTAFQVGSLSPMQIKSTDVFTQTAHVLMPNLESPYDTTSTNHPLEVLVPWQPQQEGVGYPVSANGQNDVFVETAQLDFTGQILTPVLDYLPVNCPGDDGCPTVPDGSAAPAPTTYVQILAIENEDFLGDVFLCYDTVSAANRGAGIGGISTNPGDILNAHMYTSVETILQWISSHPSAQSNCTMYVRYSPFNNYPDYIDAVGNGVRLGIEQGSGYGRVTDATIYTPGTGVQATP